MMGQIELKQRLRIAELRGQVRELLLNCQAAEARADALEARIEEAAEFYRIQMWGTGNSQIVDHEVKMVCQALDIDFEWETEEAKKRGV